mgnify:FL=1
MSSNRGAAQEFDTYIRTEDIPPEKILEYYVESEDDSSIFSQLKGPTPVVLRGCRGMGKSFLMRTAISQMNGDWENAGNDQRERLPYGVYSTLASAAIEVSASATAYEFQQWIIQQLQDSILKAFQDRFTVPADDLEPTVGSLLALTDSLQQVARFSRLILFVDEAAHVLNPARQMQFFSLMRSLRSPSLTLNAAVYPGVTYYGTEFEIGEDAEIVDLTKDPTSSEYLAWCKALASKQAPARFDAVPDQNFTYLAYAASGNPRSLLRLMLDGGKTFNAIEKHVDQTTARHSDLAEKYPGRADVVDWGREFYEDHIVPQLIERNLKLFEDAENEDSRVFLWIDSKAPAGVRLAVDLLCYSGLLFLHGRKLRTRQSTGTRYVVNLGCILNDFKNNEQRKRFADGLKTGVSPKRWVEFQGTSESFEDSPAVDLTDPQAAEIDIDKIVKRPIDRLELSDKIITRLKEGGFSTIESIYDATEDDLKTVPYIGPKRADDIYQAVRVAIYEMIS